LAGATATLGAAFVAVFVGVELQPAISRLSAIGAAVRVRGSFIEGKGCAFGNVFGSTVCIGARVV